LVLAGTALLLSESRGRGWTVLAGALLALGAVLRFHYLPAIGIFVLLTAGKDFRGTWLPLLLGGFPALCLSIFVDLVMGQAPFGWLAENFRQNILYNRSAAFGVSGPLEFAAMYGRNWGLLLLPLMLLALLPVIQRYRPLFWMAMANLILHSMIGHKEYRFVLLTTAILVILAAIGSVEWTRRLESRFSPASSRFLPLALILLWGSASAAIALSDPLRGRWLGFRPNFESAAALRSLPNLCGVGLLEVQFWESGGYSYIHRQVPLYLVQQPQVPLTKRSLVEVDPAFNAIIAPEDRQGELSSRFRKHSCSRADGKGRGSGLANGLHRVCAFVRKGSCNPAAAPDLRVDRVLRRMNF
jgi:hypothetical protein